MVFTSIQISAFTSKIIENPSLKQMIIENKNFGSVSKFVKDCESYFLKWKDGFGMNSVCLGETEEYFELVFKREEYRHLYSKYVRTANDIDDTGMTM